MTAYDVIVIGAGLSGLQAANDIQNAGLSCLVLEARDRVGGKLWSVPSDCGQGTVDLGGAWINDVNQHRALTLVRELGLEMIEQNVVGDCILEGYGRFQYGSDPPLPAPDKAALARVRDKMERLCHGMNIMSPRSDHKKYDGMSVDALATSLGATPLALTIVNIWTSAMLGFSSTNVSALYFLDYCRAGGGLKQMRSDGKGGGQHLRFRTGSQSLAKGLAGRLKGGTVILSAVAASIEQSYAKGCSVTTRDGRQFRSKKVVSSLPSPLLQDLTFSPPLSVDKTWLSEESRLGQYAKVFLRYSTPWWRQRGLCGLTQGLDGPVSLTRDASSDKDGMFTLVCFVVGESGQKWSKRTKNERVTDILAHIDRIYGPDCPRPLKTQEQLWNAEEFSKGAPCPVMSSSHIKLLGRDQWRAEGNIHFCGTETSTIWKGYMEGALTSGARVADEIIGELGAAGNISSKL